MDGGYSNGRLLLNNAPIHAIESVIFSVLKLLIFEPSQHDYFPFHKIKNYL